MTIYPQRMHVYDLANAMDKYPDDFWLDFHYMLELGIIGGDQFESCTVPGVEETPMRVWATAIGIEWLREQDKKAAR